MGTLVRVYCYCCYVQYYGRKSRCFDTYCNLYWCNFTDICRTGNVWAPILMTIFCIQYAIISYRFRYWGEMFTYLFMSLPMSVWSIVTWLKNARNSSDGTVEIRKITRKGAGVLVLCNVAVTIAFYILLKKLNTPNLIFSTISVVTSFLLHHSLCYGLPIMLWDMHRMTSCWLSYGYWHQLRTRGIFQWL